MPQWEKLIRSGSRAELSSAYVTGAVTASIFSGSHQGNGSGLTGVVTASYAVSASVINNFVFSRAATIADFTNGVTDSQVYTIWRSPYSCTITSLYAQCTGTPTGSVNARRSGSAGFGFHTGSNLRIASTQSWYTANSVMSSSYSVGDTLQFIVSGSTGITSITVQCDFIRT